LYFNDLHNEDDDDGDDESGYAYQAPGRLNGTGFVLRLTDPATGRLLTDMGSDYEGRYQPAGKAWKAEFREQEYLGYFRDKAQAEPEAFWRQYLLAKAYMKGARLEEGEEHFLRFHDKHPDSDAGRFLLAKFYDANDKGERAEALLSEMDTVSAPTFAEHLIRLLKINKEQDEAEYLAALEHILSFSPTNYMILDSYLGFLKEKGRTDQVKSYVRSFLDKHDSPKWKERLGEYLEDESYKPESYKPKTDKELDKEQKKAAKRQKKAFSLADQYTLITYAKRKEKTADVLRLYDEAIAIMPWRTALAYQRAVYLFEKERTDEALASLMSQLEQEPYDSDICETIGDIYIEKKNDAEALSWYRRAEKLGGGGYDLKGKIEKLENTKQFTGYFTPLNLSEAAKDRSWESRYPDEEAVISLFSQQITYRPETKKLEAVRKAVIHIRNDAGAKRWTEADLRLIGNVSSVKVLKKDGTVNSPDMGWGVAVFKNLQAGDIILVEGTAEHDMPDEIPGEFLDFTLLSWPSPVAKATMELFIPKELTLYGACNRLDCQYSVRDTGDFKMLQWTWNDIAKLEDEEATPDNADGTAWLMLGSVPDWSRVVQWYQRKTYLRTEPNYEVLDQGRALIKPGMTEEQIVETLHTFITRDINYSYVPFLNTNYVPKKPGATLSAKVGDCKDVATLMITLLRENGIPAWYTLVSTHSFSSQEPRPTLYVFNHAIVAYQTKDGQLHFADLTTDYFPTGILPGSDADAWALVIRDGETALRHLPNHALDPLVTRVEVNAKATLDADGNLSLDGNSRRFGTAAGNWREEYLRATQEDRRKSLSEYFGGGVLTHLDIEQFEFENLDSLNASLDMHFRLKSYNQLDKVSNLWIMPLPLPLSTPTQKAMFAAKRYNDLDADVLFELSPVRETVDFMLPEGRQLAEMPRDRRISGRFGEYVLHFEKIPGGLRIYREVTFKQRFINHKDFLEFKLFYLQMLDSDGVLLAFQ
ncbi:MAG TPA: transglutaminase domain-containing protein, partial [Saprospiraceae bacterium]|nr:transglutaminase domain-containing protein [Saprospiraceae bacterium]